ncbi:MAG: hypothetical protein JNK27_08730 [Chitinophagaceae bacterium]|nr:hypothetical protein [Chitinophagaceae bacterium]
MFKALLKKYLTVFILTFVTYTFLNWFLSTRFDTGINENYLNFWIPALVCAVITYIYLRPLVKELNYTEKGADFLLWFIIPFSMWTPIAFSQGYFKDISYGVVTIDRPSDVFKHPSERFFKIKAFTVEPDDYFIIREKHTSGKNGTTLNVSNYYIVPMHDDTIAKNSDTVTTIGYGVCFTTSMHNGFFSKKEQEPKIEDFNEKSAKEYDDYDFYNADYFEKISNTDEATYFTEAADRNSSFDHSRKPTIFVRKSGTISDLYENGKKMFIYSILISLGIGLVSMFLVNLFNDRSPAANKSIAASRARRKTNQL